MMKQTVVDKTIFNTLGYLLITFITLLCLIPYVMVLSGSVSSQLAIVQSGYSIFPREFTLDAYKLAFMNPKDIMRAFEYVNLVRIKKSKELILRHKDMQIKEIAVLSGFEDVSYFCSQFKKVEQVSPGEFRKLHTGSFQEGRDN